MIDKDGIFKAQVIAKLCKHMGFASPMCINDHESTINSLKKKNKTSKEIALHLFMDVCLYGPQNF